MTLLTRFEEKYTPEPMSGCWLWTGAYSSSGYGCFMMSDQKTVGAHRASYMIHNGPIEDGHVVMHTCDNPSCVNPEHLKAGTHADNTRDMMEKGRRIAPSTENRMRGRDWHNAHKGTLPTGEQHHQAKLTEEDVKYIRASSETGVSLAKKFDVSPKTISRVRRYEIWRDVS